MEQFICNNCSSTEYEVKDGYRICKFCGSKFKLKQDDIMFDSKIDLKDDIVRLLKKIDEHPEKAGRYAKLILQIDPNFTDVKKYID